MPGGDAKSPKKLDAAAMRYVQDSMTKFTDGQEMDAERWATRLTKKTKALTEADKLEVFERALALDSQAAMWFETLDEDEKTKDWTLTQWLAEFKKRFAKTDAQKIRDASLLKQGEDESAAMYMESKLAALAKVYPDFAVQLEMLREGIWWKYKQEFNVHAIQVESLASKPEEAKKAFVRILDAIMAKHKSWKKTAQPVLVTETNAATASTSKTEEGDSSKPSKEEDLEVMIQRVLAKQFGSRGGRGGQANRGGRERKPLSETTCYGCNELGHIKRFCPNKDKWVKSDHADGQAQNRNQQSGNGNQGRPSTTSLGNKSAHNKQSV